MKPERDLLKEIEEAVIKHYFETGLLIKDLKCVFAYSDTGNTSNQGYADRKIDSTDMTANIDLSHKGRHLAEDVKENDYFIRDVRNFIRQEHLTERWDDYVNRNNIILPNLPEKDFE